MPHGRETPFGSNAGMGVTRRRRPFTARDRTSQPFPFLFRDPSLAQDDRKQIPPDHGAMGIGDGKLQLVFSHELVGASGKWPTEAGPTQRSN